MLGKALRGVGTRSSWRRSCQANTTSQHIAEAIENSLRELGTDYVDLYQIHSPRPQYPIADTMADLLKLRDDGKIRYIGVSNFSAQQHVDAAQMRPSAQLAASISHAFPESRRRYPANMP